MVISDDGLLPLPDASVDLVLSTQVLEHAADPQVYVRECARVLRPGGKLLLSTHGVMFYHPDPEDYWRWTPAGLAVLLGDAGLIVTRQEGVLGLTAAGLTLAHEPLFHALPRTIARPVAWLVNILSALADRLESADYRRHNALVFAIVAEAPR